MTLDAFFSPRSVAVIGASSRKESVGNAVLRNLLFGDAAGDDEVGQGFGGKVYAVNPKGGEILGHKAYPSLADIDDEIDLIVVCIPGKYIAPVLDDAAKKSCGAAIIISAGFAEMGAEGKRMQDAMLQKAKSLGIRLIGPNCLGVIRPSHKLNASFGAGAPRPGGVGLLSQSGALVTGIISYAEGERFGLSTAISLGAKADVDDAEILRYLADDDETKAIAIYVEAFPDAHAAFDALRYAAQRKPVVAIKGGMSGAGAKAASSHTGALAGSSAAYKAAFAQAGVLHAPTIGDFLTWSRTLACQPPAKGKRVAIVTNAGGPGVLSADECDRHGLQLAELSAETKAKLDEVLPKVWSHNNPVDVIGDATPERYQKALEILGAADEVDGIITIMTVQAMTAPTETAACIAKATHAPGWDKPIVASFIGLVGTEAGHYLDERDIPELNTPEEAVRAMAALVKRGAIERRQAGKRRAWSQMPDADLPRAKAIIAEAKAAGQKNLDLARARDVLSAAGLRYNHSGTAKNEDEAAKLSHSIGFPLVVKLISPDVVHKSDVGGVVLDVANEEGVRQACASIREHVEAAQPGARITGFTLEEQVKGTEIIVGVSRDPSFGPLIMVGMGGIFVEVYKDVTFGLLPLTMSDALHMIDGIKAQPLLDGARKRPKLNREELAEVLLRVGALVQSCDDIVAVDVNPLVITKDELVAIDARVVV